MKIYVLGLFVLMVLTCPSNAIESEPNWEQLYEDIKQSEIQQFKSPSVGQTITIVSRIGGELTGRITALTTNTIAINKVIFHEQELTPECCDRIFANYHAVSVAEAKVKQERINYRKRKAISEDVSIVEKSVPPKEQKTTSIYSEQKNEEMKIVLPLTILAIVALIIACIVRSKPPKQFICPNCACLGVPQVKTTGSDFFEIILWFCGVIPGLIYHLSRTGAAKPVCPKCGAWNMVPLDTPRGRELRTKYHC